MDPFIHLPDCRVVICTDSACRYAVLPSNIDTHLRVRHGMSVPKRRDIINHVIVIPHLIMDQSRLQAEFRNPAPKQSPIRQIPVYTDGLACQYRACPYVCRGRNNIIRHYESAHAWDNPYKRGGSLRSRQTRDYPWQTDVHCQRLYIRGVPQEFFEVASEIVQASPPSSMADKVKQELERITQQQEAIASQEAVAQPQQMSDTNPWLDRVEWAHHLAGFPFEEMIQWAKLPRKDEITLQRICDGFSRIIDMAQQLIMSQRCTFFARVEINRKEKEKTPQRPFQARMGDDTKQRYVQVWQQMICYIYRTHQMKNRPQYQLTPDQQRELDGLIHLAQQAEDEISETEIEVENERDENNNNDSGYHKPQGPPELTPIQRQCLRICTSLLDHQVHSGHYHNAIVSALAVLGVDTEHSTWLPAENYTPKLSAVIKLARMMVILQTYDSVSDPEQAAIVKLVGREVERFMMMTKPTPMKWIFMIRTYGMKIRYSTTAPGTVQWHRGNRVQYRGTAFSVAQLQSWVHGLGEECRRMMAEDLLMFGVDNGGAIPQIPWETLCDNPSIHKPGYNFIHDERNSFPVDGSQWLFQRVMNQDDIRVEFVQDRAADDPLIWKRARISQYMKAIKRFKEKLAVLIQISAGQPARAPELLSIRHQNTRNGGRRNIFIEDGKVVVVAAYHKGYNLGGNTKIIHRYLPQEVGEIVVRYLWLVEPFQRQLKVAIEGQLFGRGYMWERGMDDSKWTSERIGRLMEKESQIGMGVKVRISAYRQMAIAIARHCLKGEGMVDDRDDEEDMEDDDDSPRSQDHILDLQAGHGSHVAGMIYARAILEAPGEVASIRQQYRHASEAWHRLLQFPSTLGVLVKKRVWESQDQDRQFAKWKRMRTLNIYKPLERIVGAGAQFRGIQEPVVKAIMRGESPIVSVMGTGAGKSLLFMLPAMCSAQDAGTSTPGMTIVVIPMISLRQDIQRRCQAVGLSCAEWDYRHPQTGVSIMLVTSESAVSHAFQAFILRIRASHHLERIVIDECHTVLDSREDFRPKLQRLSELWAAECQIVMLTATLPPEDEARFCQIMKMPRDMIQWFRAPTSRPNIVYRVHRQDGRDDEAVREVIRVLLGQYPQGKVVIYSTSVARVKTLAEKLDCEAYYRSVHEKSQVFQRIIQPECPVVVATNALGLGIDIPNIRAVIHVDGPRSIRDFGQESGRAGRDGQISFSIIMVPPEFEHSDVRVNQFIQGQTCCRVILDDYLDGRDDRRQCEAHEQACYVCQPSTPEPEEAPSEEEIQAREEFEDQARQREQLQTWVQQMRRHEAIAVDELVQYLDRWANRCPWCYAQGRTQDSTEHPFHECPAADADQVRLECEMMRKDIHYQRYCVCFHCGVPQAICHRYEGNGRGGWKWRRNGECQYKGVIIGGIVSMRRANINRCSDAIELWMQSDGANERDAQAVLEWMGRKIRWGGMEAAMINKVFYQLAIATG